MWYSFWMTNRWLLLNFDAIGATAVLITTLFAITTMSGNPGVAGISITTAMGLTWAGTFLVCNSRTVKSNDYRPVYWFCHDLTGEKHFTSDGTLSLFFWIAMELDLKYGCSKFPYHMTHINISFNRTQFSRTCRWIVSVSHLPRDLAPLILLLASIYPKNL